MTTKLLGVFTEGARSFSGIHRRIIASEVSNQTLQEMLKTGTNVTHDRTTSFRASMLGRCEEMNLNKISLFALHVLNTNK
jgi:deoxyhypusine synthase